MTAQLQLPITECDPRLQREAARKLQRIVKRTRNSFECIDFRKRREAMLKVTRVGR
jgi:hypothetical protein